MFAQLEEQRMFLATAFLSPCCALAANILIYEGSSPASIAYPCAVITIVDTLRILPFLLGVNNTASTLGVGPSQITWELLTRPTRDRFLTMKEGAEVPLCLRAKCARAQAVDFRLAPQGLRQLQLSQIRQLHHIADKFGSLRCLTFGSCNMLKSASVEELSRLLTHLNPNRSDTALRDYLNTRRIRCRIEGPMDLSAQALTDKDLEGWLSDFVNAGAELDVLILSDNPALTVKGLSSLAATLEQQYQLFADRGGTGVRYVRAHQKYLPLHSLRSDVEVSLIRKSRWELSTLDMAFIGYHLARNTGLKSLELGCVVPGEDAMQLLEAALITNNSLQWFALNSIPIPIREVKSYQYVTLIDLQIGDDDARLVAALACANVLLEDLDLRNNHIGDVGMTALGASVDRKSVV